MIRYYLILIVGFVVCVGGLLWGASTNSKGMMLLGAVPGVCVILGVMLWVAEYQREIDERVRYQRAKTRRAQARRLALLRGR